MARIRYGLDYDDILLLPEPSEVNSRENVDMCSDLRGRITHRKLYPIFSAPMKEISGYDLVSSLSDNKVLGFLHRFLDDKTRMTAIAGLSNTEKDFGVAVKLGEIKMAEFAQSMGATMLCVDIANGYIKSLRDFIYELRDRGIDIPIMSGNVVTFEGVRDLVESGANYVRVGIGSGTLCSTRETTGIGCPQLTALGNSSSYIGPRFIVSDGGINSPARAVKSFVFGANFVMIGTLFANAFEAENEDGTIYGMASRKLQEDTYGAVKSVEGRELKLDFKDKRPIKNIVDEFVNGIKSACTYLNCSSYKELVDKSESCIETGKGSLR